jgi:hypothetical protein
MSDVVAFEAMAANVVALVGTGNSATDTAALSSINTKLDALLASASNTTQTPRTSTLSVATVTRIAAIASRKQQMGMNATTGRVLTDLEHLEQSVADILLTPIGTRVMRRDYGSQLPDLLDQNITPSLVAAVFAASAEALHRWEPRFKLTRLKVDKDNTSQMQGRLTLWLVGLFNGAEISVGVAT